MPNEIKIVPLSGHTGAEIRGIDISRPLDPKATATIQTALDAWKVVFFRGQELDHAAHISFGRCFGELTYAHPYDNHPPDGYPEILTLNNEGGGVFKQRFGIDDPEQARRAYHEKQQNAWHTDTTPAVNPPSGSILRAEVVPAYGGDTHFTNLVAAYEGLSEPVQRLVDSLRAEHFYDANPLGLNRSEATSSRPQRSRLIAHHPVVRVHPRTGEKALLINPLYTDHILGVPRFESRWILEFLFTHFSRPEYTVRFHWDPGSVAFWDNQATAHLGPQDLAHLDVERLMHRVTLIGDIPVGPDGRESELVEGVPFTSLPIFATADSS